MLTIMRSRVVWVNGRMLSHYFNTLQQLLEPLSGVGDGDLNLYAGLNVDGGDLLHNLGGAVEVNHSLVDPHLELVPGLGSLSARSLPGGDPEHLGRHPHRPC